MRDNRCTARDRVLRDALRVSAELCELIVNAPEMPPEHIVCGSAPPRCCGCCRRFDEIVGNWGIAIILLTFLVKG